MPEVLTETTRFRGAEDVVFTAMEDEAVLLNLTTKEYYGLNESGMRIWQLVQIGASIAEMAAAIAEDYEVTLEGARDAAGRSLSRAPRRGSHLRGCRGVSRPHG